jgi:hypothetical protein
MDQFCDVYLHDKTIPYIDCLGNRLYNPVLKYEGNGKHTISSIYNHDVRRIRIDMPNSILLCMLRGIHYCMLYNMGGYDAYLMCLIKYAILRYVFNSDAHDNDIINNACRIILDRLQADAYLCISINQHTLILVDQTWFSLLLDNIVNQAIGSMRS